MNTVILKCKPGSFYRIGEGSLNDVGNIIHADTLFSGLANIYELIYGEGDNFVQMVEEGKILFSSALPVLENLSNQNFIYFLPKPYIKFTNAKLLGKKEKKIKFISFEALKLLLKGFDNTSFTSEVDFSLLQTIADEFWCLKEEIFIDKIPENKRVFMKKILFPKTKVHSETKEDSFYFQTDIQLLPMTDESEKISYLPHFYFYFRHSLTEKEFKKFTACLRVLADEGLGGDRSAGKGKFDDIIFREVDLSFGTGSKVYLNLSTLNPKDQEEFDKCIYYDLIKRGGGSLGEEGNKDNHRKQVRMIAEGSILTGEVKGRIVDISPSVNYYHHKIYRNGKAFLIPIG